MLKIVHRPGPSGLAPITPLVSQALDLERCATHLDRFIMTFGYRAQEQSSGGRTMGT